MAGKTVDSEALGGGGVGRIYSAGKYSTNAEMRQLVAAIIWEVMYIVRQ